MYRLVLHHTMAFSGRNSHVSDKVISTFILYLLYNCIQLMRMTTKHAANKTSDN